MDTITSEEQRNNIDVAMDHARVLTEAMPWVKALAGSTIVIKYGGAAMVDPALRANVMSDIMLLKLVGADPILVHGGGKDINAMVGALKLSSEFVDGLRVTTPEVMQVVSMVLNGKVNEELVLALNAHGPIAVGMSGVDGSMVHCEFVDDVHGRVGTVRRVDTDLITTTQAQGFIPVISSIGIGPDGGVVNVNADSMASAIAQACGASKVVFLTDVDGIYRDFDDKASLIGRMTVDDAQQLIDSGTLSSGMIPKVQAAVDALAGSVRRAHILNGKVPHSIILELLTDTGIGTMITRTSDDLFRHDTVQRIDRKSLI